MSIPPPPEIANIHDKRYSGKRFSDKYWKAYNRLNQVCDILGNFVERLEQIHIEKYGQLPTADQLRENPMLRELETEIAQLGTVCRDQRRDAMRTWESLL